MKKMIEKLILKEICVIKKNNNKIVKKYNQKYYRIIMFKISLY